jgi:hypothetical protein
MPGSAQLPLKMPADTDDGSVAGRFAGAPIPGRPQLTDHVIVSPARPQLGKPTDPGENATRDIAGGLKALLADVFAIYLKTKNFHWHMSGLNAGTITSCSTDRATRSSR